MRLQDVQIESVNLFIKLGKFSKYRKSFKSGTERKRLCIVFTSSINHRKCRIRKFTLLLCSSNKFNTTCDAHAVLLISLLSLFPFQRSSA